MQPTGTLCPVAVQANFWNCEDERLVRVPMQVFDAESGLVQVSFLRSNLSFRVEAKSYNLTEDGQPAHMEQLVSYIR